MVLGAGIGGLLIIIGVGYLFARNNNKRKKKRDELGSPSERRIIKDAGLTSLLRNERTSVAEAKGGEKSEEGEKKRLLRMQNGSTITMSQLQKRILTKPLRKKQKKLKIPEKRLSIQPERQKRLLAFLPHK